MSGSKLLREGGFLKRFWFGFSDPFGFPFGWWGTVGVGEELNMLREYRYRLGEELERFKERIRRLEGRARQE